MQKTTKDEQKEVWARHPAVTRPSACGRRGMGSEGGAQGSYTLPGEKGRGGARGNDSRKCQCSSQLTKIKATDRSEGDLSPQRKVGKSQASQLPEGFLFGTFPVLCVWLQFAYCLVLQLISLILASPSFSSILGGSAAVLPNPHTLRLEGPHLSSNTILSKCLTVTTQ